MKSNRFKKRKKQRKNRNNMWQYILLVGFLLFLLAYVPTVNTLAVQICITQDGKIQNVPYQIIKVPLITAYGSGQTSQSTTFYFIILSGLPKQLDVYGTVGCNNLYWYNAQNGTYNVKIDVQTYFQNQWVLTDTELIDIKVG